MAMKSKTREPCLSVIIPTYNRPEKLIRCLKSVFNSTYKNIEVIVINDYPKSNLKPLLNEFKICLIQHKKEQYLIKSRNEGAELAKGKMLFFLDDDNIINRTSIKSLVSKYLKTKNIGLLGPLMYNSFGDLWFYGGTATWINPNLKPVPKSELKHDLIETDGIPNAYLVSKKLYTKIGGEDPNLPTHSEPDLAQRFKRVGYKNYIYPKATIMHDIGKKNINLIDRPPYRTYITVKCNFFLEKRYAPKLKFLLFLFGFVPVHMILYLLYYIPFKANNKREYYRAYLKGLKEGLSIKANKLVK